MGQGGVLGQARVCGAGGGLLGQLSERASVTLACDSRYSLQ
jgi:hypothetical protein